MTAPSTDFPVDAPPADDLDYVVGLIAHRLANGQSVDHVIDVGERTGWWFPDLVDWVADGRHGPTPTGPAPVLPTPTEQDHSPSCVLDTDHDSGCRPAAEPIGALADQPRAVDAMTSEQAAAEVDRIEQAHAATGQPVAGPYVAVLRLNELFVDHTYQRPLDEARVRRMATAWDPRLLGLLDVSDRGTDTEPVNRYAIVNGQHRAALAALVGLTHVACNIHDGLDVPAEAQLMATLDATTKKLSGFEKWRARRGAGDQAVQQVEDIAARHGLTVGPGRGDDVLTSYGAAEKLLQLGGPQLLDNTLAVLHGAYGLTAAAWQAPLVTGVGQLLHRTPDIDIDRLGRALASNRPEQLRAQAAAAREIEPGTLAQLMTRVITTQYRRAAR
ncbi:DUF6551 family protein [Modestobacter sp. VKM Ac-2985]|uniref:DUF6551 family protein n=1 Tax=Modestobacter sp. VKM Ac-2985 TaxID=3004139 RepID=UPI0022AB99A9|nr:DUF6551 family protein [Modestobacter sp. VKM Ac-2985]MCZ2837164.1 hypothetical protein [Modestobacter sp. VKM Ac-2985]